MGYAGVVSGRVGLHIGLRGFNITLVGEPQCQFNTVRGGGSSQRSTPQGQRRTRFAFDQAAPSPAQPRPRDPPTPQSVVWNEHITWADPTGQLEGWQQGRLGFGAYASPISQQLRDLAYKGVPRPILDVAEWFT